MNKFFLGMITALALFAGADYLRKQEEIVAVDTSSDFGGYDYQDVTPSYDDTDYEENDCTVRCWI